MLGASSSEDDDEDYVEESAHELVSPLSLVFSFTSFLLFVVLTTRGSQEDQ